MGVISRNSSVSLPNRGFITGEFSVEAVRPSAICSIKNREDSPLIYLSVHREVGLSEEQKTTSSFLY